MIQGVLSSLSSVSSTAFMNPDAGGSWNVTNLLTSLTSSAEGWGGLILTLIGTVGVIVCFLIMGIKFFTNSFKDWSWFKLGLGVIVLGAMAFGGINLITSIAQGGYQTIRELGAGS